MSNQQRFEVGEIAIYHNPVSRLHGHEVQILGPLRPGRLLDHTTGAFDRCEIYPLLDMVTGKRGDRFPYGAPPEKLRKKPGQRAREETGSWDALPFYTPPSRADLAAFEAELT